MNAAKLKQILTIWQTNSKKLLFNSLQLNPQKLILFLGTRLSGE